MTAIATDINDVRADAARLAFALVRFAGAAAHPPVRHRPPQVPEVGTDAFVFGPSWRRVPHDEVESFLVGLPSPALLIPTVTRGEVALMLVHELSGDRRRSAEKTITNLAAFLDENVSQLNLPETSRVLVEFDDESHVFSLAAVREWARQLAVSIGCNLAPLQGDERANACLMLMRADGRPFPGRSCMIPRRWTR